MKYPSSRLKPPETKRAAIFVLLKDIEVAEKAVIDGLREKEAHQLLERMSAASSQLWDALYSLHIYEIASLASLLHTYHSYVPFIFCCFTHLRLPCSRILINAEEYDNFEV